jgi:transcriptional regulator GlxA family with amidase domain
VPADIAVIGFDNARLASLGLFLDAFEFARLRVAAMFEARDTVGMATRVRLLAPGGGAILLAGGRRMPVDGGLDDAVHGLIHVPDFESDQEPAADLARLAGPVGWLGRQHRSGCVLSATGRGLFLLAEAGVLGQGPIAIAPALAPAFHRRYPGVQIDRRASMVDRGMIVTTRGLATELRMIAHLVERFLSPLMAGSLAEAAALERSEGDGLSDDPLVAAAQVWLGEHYASGARIASLAEQLAVSQQTLIRRFRARLGTTPRDYVQMLRIRSAQTQLRQTSRPIAQIATLVGYDDLKSFREAFRARTGMSASQYRLSGEVEA